MSVDRVIPAERVDTDSIESFPYFAAQFSPSLEDEPVGDDDSPLAAELSSPEEDARRLASADQIIYEKMQQAERDAHDIARRAYEEGFASGEAEGRTFGESQYKAQIQRLDGALAELSASLSINAKATQDEILALSLAMAEYLAGREIDEGTRSIGPLLTTLLASHPFPESSEDPSAAPGLTVLLNPKDLEALAEGAKAHPGVTLREDGALSRGSLRVESAVGVLDATVERRKARLLELIHKTHSQEAV